MVKVDSQLEIEKRTPEEVFDFIADFRNEQRWDEFNQNPRMLTDGPVRLGSRFEALNQKMGPVQVEIAEYQRPARLAMKITTRMGTMVFTAQFADAPDGTRMTATNEMELKGLFRLFSPLIRRMIRKQQPMHQAKLKRYLEQSFRAA